MTTFRAVQSQLDRVWRRVQMAVANVKILATNDSGPIHQVQIRGFANEVIDNVKVAQLYGFSSHAQPGSDAVAVFNAGDRSAGMIVATNNQKARLRNLKPGEVAIYTDEGDSVIMQRGKIVQVNCGAQVIVTTPLVTVNANQKVRMVTPRLEVTGDIIDHCDTQSHTAANMRTIYNTHTHPGIQSGSANTGQPNQPQE